MRICSVRRRRGHYLLNVLKNAKNLPEDIRHIFVRSHEVHCRFINKISHISKSSLYSLKETKTHLLLLKVNK